MAPRSFAVVSSLPDRQESLSPQIVLLTKEVKIGGIPVRMTSIDGRTWHMLGAQPLVTPEAAQLSAMRFAQPIAAPYGASRGPERLVKQRKSRKIMRATQGGATKKKHLLEESKQRIRDAFIPNPTRDFYEKPPKPSIQQGGDFNLVHSYSDIRG